MTATVESKPDYDLIVIGAGINGAAIAREATLHGKRVLLLDSRDVASGTSAASTRLIHGGLRYLEYAEFGLVYESLAERERLLASAAHLVAPLKLYLPIYARAKRARWQVRVGLSLYDLLSVGKSLPAHRMLSRAELCESLPGLSQTDLRGGACYFDAQITFPERLVLELIQDAVANGLRVETYAPVSEILVEDGSVCGVRWQQAGRDQTAAARLVVNAAGPWVDRVLSGLGSEPLIGGTRGSHIVVGAFPGAPQAAVYAEAASDNRPFFVIPWNGLYLIGTTDEPEADDPSQVRATAAEVDYLSTETARLFNGASNLQIHYTQTGVRPLPRVDARMPAAITRRHAIVESNTVDGLYSIVGGKLTTHRSLAEQTLGRLRPRLGTGRESPTRSRPLPGHLPAAERAAFIEWLESRVGKHQARRLFHIYGAGAERIVTAIESSPELGALGAPARLYVAELVHGLEREWASNLVDLLYRRTMIGLDADRGLDSVIDAATCLRNLGLWDSSRVEQEVAAYREYSARFAVP